MFVRTCNAAAIAATLALCAGCASPPDKVAGDYHGKQYRTGSNIPVHDGDMPGDAKVVKPDAVPIFKGPGPRVGPTGGGGG